MSILTILILAAAAILLRLAFPGRGRAWALLVVSVLAVFYLQPALPVRGLDFWLPTATILITALSWLVTAEPEERTWKKTLPVLALIAGIILLIATTRYLSINGILTPSHPPQLWQVLAALAACGMLFFLLSLWQKPTAGLAGGIILLIALLVVLKHPVLNALLASWFSRLTGGSVANFLSFDIRWLGFSYIAFRLIHTLRDRMTGRLPRVSLLEYFDYVLFLPTLSAWTY